MNFLHAAIRENNLSLLMEQLQERYSHKEINAFENTTGDTPLELALFLGRFDMALLLLVYGANPNIRTENRQHVFFQIMERNCGDLFASLLFMAPSIDTHFKERFLGQIKFNSSVFHVLFYTALRLYTNTCAPTHGGFAKKLLTETLPALPADIRVQLIGTLTGAFYYCAKHHCLDNIFELLETLKVATVDDRLPNYGVGILPFKPQVETKVSLAEAVNTNNYLEIDKAQNTEVDLPFTAANLPWLLLKGKDVYSHVNSLIQDEKWNELKKFEAAGFSIPQHLYMIIKDPGQMGNTLLIRKLKNYPSLVNNFNEELEKQFLFVICDHSIVNEPVLHFILSLRSPEEKHKEVKHEDTVKSKLSALEAKLIQLRANVGALQKFRVLKNEILTPPAANNMQNKLMEQSVILWKISSYLTQKQTYTQFACLVKNTRKLALQDRLANPPSAWQRFNPLIDKEKKIDAIIAELVPYKQSLRAYFHNALCASGNNVCTAKLGGSSCFTLTSTLSIDATVTCCNYGVGPFLATTGGKAGAGCNAASFCCQIPLSTWLWMNIGIPLAAVCGLGVVGGYYYCDKNIPGVDLAELNQEGQHLVERAVACLPAGHYRPHNTTYLIQALIHEKEQIQNTKLLYKMKTAEAAQKAAQSVALTESKVEAKAIAPTETKDNAETDWTDLNGVPAASIEDLDEPAAASLRRPLLPSARGSGH